MRFGVLGPIRAWDGDGRELAIGGPRLRALLARLLIDPGRVVSTTRLIDDLYGDRPPAGAANALQSQVSRLRRSLGAGLVEFHPDGYRLAADPDQVDAHRFTRLAAAGHRALAGGDPSRAAELLREALSQWRGPALAGVTDAPFAGGQATRLGEQRLAATEDRVEAELMLGESATLVPELRELTAAHPLRERLRGQLMRSLAGSGRSADALAVFDDYRRRLVEDLGTDPSAELVELHRAVLRGEATPAPRPQTVPAAPTPVAPAPRTGLPAQLTSFVGREEELRRVGKLLAEARLVTLTGPGGAGKTRLAVEAAGRQPGETWFVELAPVAAGADVALAVLGALGLREAGLRDPATGGPGPTERLAAAIGSDPALLLLDNCEHVVADAARLAGRLLAACPQLRIVATSREPLGLTGEALCPLSGLPLPPPEGSGEASQQYAAVRLFADRAADVTAGTSHDPALVATICQTLDGLPLAIELAAARLRSLSLAEIADRLDDRFRLLSRGSRTAAPRHQTLRAVVGWSWDLLDEDEQALARRLTVFAGGATLEAAERVTGLPGAEVVELLANLVEKSLVEQKDGRYRMLETIRAYGAEQLAAHGEEGQLRRAHAGYFLHLAQTADPHLRRPEQLSWLSRLDAERDNLHAALRRSAAAGEHATALRLVAALSMYWWLRGLRGEAALLAGEVLAGLGEQPPPELTEEYSLCVLNAGLSTAGLDQSVEVWSQEMLIFRPNRPPRQPFVMYLSAIAAGPPAGGPDELVALVDQSRPVFEDPWVRALAPIGIGLLKMYGGEPADAESYLAEGVAEFRQIGDRWGLMTSLAMLAELAGWRGDHQRTVTAIAETLRLAEELGSTVDMADQLNTLGSAQIRLDDVAGAAETYQRAVTLAARAGAPEIVAAARTGLAEVALRRDDPAQARRLCETALAECPVDWFAANLTRAGTYAMLGRIAQAEGQLALARHWFQLSLTSRSPGLAEAVVELAGVAHLEGNAAQAARLLGAGTVLLEHRQVFGALKIRPLAQTLRAELGTDPYERAFAEGAGCSLAQAWQLLGVPPPADR